MRQCHASDGARAQICTAWDTSAARFGAWRLVPIFWLQIRNSLSPEVWAVRFLCSLWELYALKLTKRNLGAILVPLEIIKAENLDLETAELSPPHSTSA